MTIQDGNFILYTPARAPAADPHAAPLTRGVWQSEMTDWLGLFEPAAATFTAVDGGAAASEIPPDEAAARVAQRRGSVLDSGMVLKADQYPGIHTKALNSGKDPQPFINGAPNYRELPARPGETDRPVRGVAQPTIDGMRGVLEEAGARERPVMWTNLREEPVVYLNGRPFNMRREDDIRSNLANPGADGHDVERTEGRLKHDIQAEAARNHGRLLIHDETPDGRIVARWETVTPESVQTPREVYDMLRHEGYQVDYARIPVTDEKVPEEKDFDALVDRLKKAGPDEPMIFNCHAGRGRTTTGMVAAGLMRRAQEGVDPESSITKSRPVHEDIREQGKYKRGEYKVINRMIDVLERGPQDKAEADATIDQFSGLQNLRESIESYKVQSETAATPQARGAAKQRGQDYLERYFYLVAFDAYAREQAPAGYPQHFSAWMKEHPELHGMLGNLELAMGMTAPGGPAYA